MRSRNTQHLVSHLGWENGIKVLDLRYAVNES